MATKGKHGGARKGAGRKPKADEHKTTEIFKIALREIYDVKTDDDAKKEFTKDLLKFSRGQLFIAEHLFGKPKENVDLNVSKRPDLSHITTDELRDLLDNDE
jgi:hypothetical protein